jgi:RimJ/RimL family protein N-acetyltransferase
LARRKSDFEGAGVIYELSKDKYERVRVVLQSMDHHLAVKSIAEGDVPGQIYVDDLVTPKAALVRLKHRFYLAGDAGNDAFNGALQRFFADEVYPLSLAAGDYALVLHFAPDEWAEQIDIILKDKFPIASPRQYYAIGKPEMDWRTFTPAGYALRCIDQELLADTSLKNHALMIEEILSERFSVEQYLNQDFGFCALHGNEIVGLCFSEHTTGDRCEVGIQTFQGHRRQGLATAMALALTERALANGITCLGWHCYADNHPSIATANKVGFEKVLDYPSYYACFKAADNLAANGYRRFQRGQHQEAIACWEKAFRTGDAPTWAYYMAARAWAALSDYAAALELLRQALEKGWTDIAVPNDADEFKPLHGREAWNAVLADMQKKSEAAISS